MYNHIINTLQTSPKIWSNYDFSQTRSEIQWSLHNSNHYNSNISLTRENSLAPWKFPDKLLWKNLHNSNLHNSNVSWTRIDFVVTWMFTDFITWIFLQRNAKCLRLWVLIVILLVKKKLSLISILSEKLIIKRSYQNKSC